MPDIFISYRRGDTAGYAGRLFDSLTARYGRGHVFMDLDSISPGVDFVDRIQEAIKTCDVAIVLMGDKWSRIERPEGGRRLDDPNDFVRLEVASALARSDIRVVPVLVEGAKMPTPAELPEDLHALARVNALELSDARWLFDVDRLAAAIPKDPGSRRARHRVRRLPLLVKIGIPLLAAAGIAIGIVTLAPTHRGEAVLFKDNFSKPTTQFRAFTNNLGTTKYVNGTFHVSPVPYRLHETSGGLAVNYTGSIPELGSMHVAADAWLVSGTTRNNMTVSCVAVGGGYEFAIGSNGLVGLAKSTKSGDEALKLIYSQAAVHAGRNHIDGYCHSDGDATTLRIKVNGRQLLEVKDTNQPYTTFESVGLKAASLTPGRRVEVAFDNVVAAGTTA